jgi:hypothetical protein
MIPSSYFFKNAYCRQWEQPEMPEGAALEVERVKSAEQGLFRRIIAAIVASQGRVASVPGRDGNRDRISAQRG